PLLLREVALFGHKIAADLQAAGLKGVITNSSFDTWWHGGFRTAPYYHNSIGILSEAASARLMSPTKVTTEQLERASARGMASALSSSTNFPDPWPGGEWHARDIMELEMRAARSILSLAAKYRRQHLQNFFQLGQNAVTKRNEGEPVAYVVPAGQGRDEAVAKLLGTLVDQGIEVFRLDRELHATYGPQVLQRTNSSDEKLGIYRKLIASTSTMQEIPAGSYIIFLSQPQRSNVLTLFEPQIYPNRVVGGEAEKPYDVTAWTLSMQMGVDVPAVTAIQEAPDDRKLTLVHGQEEVRRDLALKVAIAGLSPIQKPIASAVRIGLYKSAMGNVDEGWTRFIFDTFNVPYTSIDDAQMRRAVSTNDFDVIVLPSQQQREIIEGYQRGTYPTEFTGGLTSSGVANLKNFVESGGTLICFDAACEVPIKQFNLPIRNALDGLKASEFYCPGSIVSIDLDRSQPMSRGMLQTLDAYFINSSAFETTDPSVRVIARYAKQNLLQSGWLLGENKLRGKIALAEVPLGKGQVILFAF
ncbi:MAG TPA: hypothetical protein VIV66_08550, partial [Pyrinomonadaceae bacterium]